MTFLLLILFCNDATLLMKDGKAIPFDSLRRQDDQVLVRRGDSFFNLEADKVDWQSCPQPQAGTPLVDGATDNLPFGDIRISRIDVRQTSLIDLLRFLADEGHFNLFIDSSVKDQLVTLLLTDVTMNQVLELLLGNLGLAAEWQASTFRFTR